MEDIDEIIEDYPDITDKKAIGTSVLGNKIYVVKIGKNVRKGRPLLRPMVKIVANMHGDEPLGMELMPFLIR